MSEITIQSDSSSSSDSGAESDVSIGTLRKRIGERNLKGRLLAVGMDSDSSDEEPGLNTTVKSGGTTIAVKSEVTGDRNVCSASEVLPGSSCGQNIESQGNILQQTGPAKPSRRSEIFLRERRESHGPSVNKQSTLCVKPKITKKKRKCDDLLSLCVAGGVAGQDIKEKKLKKMFPDAARISIEENKSSASVWFNDERHYKAARLKYENKPPYIVLPGGTVTYHETVVSPCTLVVSEIPQSMSAQDLNKIFPYARSIRFTSKSRREAHIHFSTPLMCQETLKQHREKPSSTEPSREYPALRRALESGLEETPTRESANTMIHNQNQRQAIPVIDTEPDIKVEQDMNGDRIPTIEPPDGSPIIREQDNTSIQQTDSSKIQADPLRKIEQSRKLSEPARKEADSSRKIAEPNACRKETAKYGKDTILHVSRKQADATREEVADSPRTQVDPLRKETIPSRYEADTNPSRTEAGLSRKQDDQSRDKAKPSNVEGAPARREADLSRKEAYSSRRNYEPSRKEADPSRKKYDLSRKEVDPSKRNYEPSRKEADSSKINNEPSRKEADPSKINNELSRKEADPSTINNEPSRKEADPSKINNEPSRKEADPSRRNYEPSRQEADPSRRKYEPLRKEADPSRRNFEPSRKETDPSRRNYEPSRKEADLSRRNYEQPTKEAYPSRRNYEPSRKEADPSRRNYEPSRQEADPSRRDHVHSRKEADPSRRNYEPSRKEADPPRRNYEPSRKETDPSRRYYEPSRQEADPSRRDHVHSRKEADPSRRNNELSRKGADPSRRNSVPSRQEADPSRINYEPSTKEADPSRKEAATSVKEPDSSRKVADPSRKDYEPSRREDDQSRKVADPYRKVTDLCIKVNDFYRKVADPSSEETVQTRKEGSQSRKHAETSRKEDSSSSKTPGIDRQLLQASKTGDLEVVEKLLTTYPDLLNCLDLQGSLSTPLHQAAECGQLEVAEYLLKHKANVNAKDKSGLAPLHNACSYGHRDMAELLLKFGANVNAGDKHKITPLHEAAFKDYTDIFKLLIKYGADCGLKNCLGDRPLDFWKGKGSRDATKKSNTVKEIPKLMDIQTQAPKKSVQKFQIHQREGHQQAQAPLQEGLTKQSPPKFDSAKQYALAHRKVDSNDSPLWKSERRKFILPDSSEASSTPITPSGPPPVTRSQIRQKQQLEYETTTVRERIPSVKEDEMIHKRKLTADNKDVGSDNSKCISKLLKLSGNYVQDDSVRLYRTSEPTKSLHSSSVSNIMGVGHNAHSRVTNRDSVSHYRTTNHGSTSQTNQDGTVSHLNRKRSSDDKKLDPYAVDRGKRRCLSSQIKPRHKQLSSNNSRPQPEYKLDQTKSSTAAVYERISEAKVAYDKRQSEPKPARTASCDTLVSPCKSDRTESSTTKSYERTNGMKSVCEKVQGKSSGMKTTNNHLCQKISADRYTSNERNAHKIEAVTPPNVHRLIHGNENISKFDSADRLDRGSNMSSRKLSANESETASVPKVTTNVSKEKDDSAHENKQVGSKETRASSELENMTTDMNSMSAHKQVDSENKTKSKTPVKQISNNSEANLMSHKVNDLNPLLPLKQNCNYNVTNSKIGYIEVREQIRSNAKHKESVCLNIAKDEESRNDIGGLSKTLNLPVTDDNNVHAAKPGKTSDEKWIEANQQVNNKRKKSQEACPCGGGKKKCRKWKKSKKVFNKKKILVRGLRKDVTKPEILNMFNTAKTVILKEENISGKSLAFLYFNTEMETQKTIKKYRKQHSLIVKMAKANWDDDKNDCVSLHEMKIRERQKKKKTL